MKKSKPKSPYLTPPKSLNRYGKRLWARLQKQYRIQDEAGLALLHRACQSHGFIEEGRETIKKDGGPVQVDRFGQQKPHVLLKPLRDAESSFLQAMRLLNFDPPDDDGPPRKLGRPLSPR